MYTAPLDDEVLTFYTLFIASQGDERELNAIGGYFLPVIEHRTAQYRTKEGTAIHIGHFGVSEQLTDRSRRVRESKAHDRVCNEFKQTSGSSQYGLQRLPKWTSYHSIEDIQRQKVVVPNLYIHAYCTYHIKTSSRTSG